MQGLKGDRFTRGEKRREGGGDGVTMSLKGGDTLIGQSCAGLGWGDEQETQSVTCCDAGEELYNV